MFIINCYNEPGDDGTLELIRYPAKSIEDAVVRFADALVHQFHANGTPGTLNPVKSVPVTMNNVQFYISPVYGFWLNPFLIPSRVEILEHFKHNKHDWPFVNAELFTKECSDIFLYHHEYIGASSSSYANAMSQADSLYNTSSCDEDDDDDYDDDACDCEACKPMDLE